ncbi:OmpP1/FadL family transporter [Roseiconus lacunae]|uniref:Outer membrane protein transport protein n=1 Tax=Roseiconus lacunae TaxID=2605694 RepID=A0ABT7PMY5_9BACT|nr:outer membrane protein transport protein [Roseiconus lacunae]MCD0462654.1 outer membrane protein transport protein [Roseiconus lacunae]MDM4017852.1 outer membrane protein transport protein [Roseiconus lacunae]WRQ52572.1 outer membrane protein transport protein [Stieleria sp. HD01]
MKVRSIGIGLALTGLIGTSNLCADGTIRDGVGARSIGRGGTNIAHHDNAHVMLDNPSGLARLEGEHLFEIGGHLLLTDLEYWDADNPRTGDTDNPFPIGEVAIAKRLSDDVVVGLGMFSHAGFAAEYTMNGPSPFSGPRHYKSIGALARLLPTLSLRLTDRLSAGAAVGASVGHIEFEGPYTLQGPNALAGTPTLVDAQGTGVAPHWSVGLQYELTEATTIGISYIAETEMSLNGTTVTTVPLAGTARYDSVIEKSWPKMLGIGIAHRTAADRTFSMDAIWLDWSGSYQQIDLNLKTPDNPTFQVLAPTLVESIPLSWRDTVSLRFGVEQPLANDNVFRVGYAYHRNPIPSATLTPFIQTTVEHSLCFGYGWNWGGCEMDFAYQWMFGPDQYVGTSDFTGGDFDQSGTFAAAHQFSLSLRRRR